MAGADAGIVYQLGKPHGRFSILRPLPTGYIGVFNDPQVVDARVARFREQKYVRTN